MASAAKILGAAKQNPKGVSFAELKKLTEAAGFALKRTQGSHHIFSRPNTVEIINLQKDGPNAKPYQVKQVLDLIEKYSIVIE
jgi:predicted RNA binding protein YcfA (HicA-like mRNA interferase family)